jgi:hypothetical protein
MLTIQAESQTHYAGIPSWNDDYGRTQRQVVAMFDLAIQRAKPKITVWDKPRPIAAPQPVTIIEKVRELISV